MSHQPDVSASSAGSRSFCEPSPTGGGKPIEQMPPPEARAALAGLQSSVKVDLPDADVAERTITSEGQTVKLVVVRPAGVTGTLPVFMFFHGGGWVLGDFPTHERLVRDLVAGSGAAAVFVEYIARPKRITRSPSIRPTPRPRGWPPMATRSTSMAGDWPSPATASAETWRPSSP